MKLIIGVDESGTGAWAGPFTVCAYAVFEHEHANLTRIGARDSKTMSDIQRRSIFEELINAAIVANVFFVEVELMNAVGKQGAWRHGVRSAIMGVVAALPSGHQRVIVIDGAKDVGLRLGEHAEFLPKADRIIPAVSAASVIAKTMRNDAMLKLHDQFPKYGWAKSMGYGTPDHQRALKTHGKTVQHRTWGKAG